MNTASNSVKDQSIIGRHWTPVRTRKVCGRDFTPRERRRKVVGHDVANLIDTER